MEDEKIFSGLASEMTRWLPDIRHELVNVILLKESIVLCMHVHSMRRLGLSEAWLNSSELWNTLELIGFSSVRFKRCGSLGRSNHVGRLDKRGMTRLFFFGFSVCIPQQANQDAERECVTRLFSYADPDSDSWDLDMKFETSMSSSYLGCYSGWIQMWSLCSRVVSFIVTQWQLCNLFLLIILLKL